ncbi:MAG: hypothetical protein KDA45_03390, partial [Planctomycetales bacterium]|nr:hypothetical protein [Planctomycetales bacterium]
MTTVSLTALPQPASAAQPRPKLLYLVHRFPYPPNRGDRIRSYHLLRFLAARYQVYLGTLWDEVPEPQDWLAVRSLCAEVAAYPVGHYGRWLRAASGLARGRSATEGLFQSSALAHQVGRWLKTFHFDLALAFCSSMVQYVAAARDVPLIVDLVDVDSQKWLDYSQRSRGWRRWLFRLEGRRLRRLECSLPARCRAVTLAGEVEAELFRGLCPNGRTVGLANGVDMQYFAPRPSASDSPPVEARCVFVGALDYRANVQGLEWFCEHCWPGIRRQRPDATLDLVGRRPVAAVQRLA